MRLTNDWWAWLLCHVLPEPFQLWSWVVERQSDSQIHGFAKHLRTEHRLWVDTRVSIIAIQLKWCRAVTSLQADWHGPAWEMSWRSFRLFLFFLLAFWICWLCGPCSLCLCLLQSHIPQTWTCNLAEQPELYITSDVWTQVLIKVKQGTKAEVRHLRASYGCGRGCRSRWVGNGPMPAMPHSIHYKPSVSPRPNSFPTEGKRSILSCSAYALLWRKGLVGI